LTIQPTVASLTLTSLSRHLEMIFFSSVLFSTQYTHMSIVLINNLFAIISKEARLPPKAFVTLMFWSDYQRALSEVAGANTLTDLVSGKCIGHA